MSLKTVVSTGESEDVYTALPPAGWDCTSYHPTVDPEETQPGDEDFTVIYDDGALIVVSTAAGYHGHLCRTRHSCTISQTLRGLAAAGLTVTHASATNVPGEYTIRLRKLTPTERELYNDLD